MFKDKRADIRIRSSRVKCQNYEIGCEWIGELDDLLKVRTLFCLFCILELIFVNHKSRKNVILNWISQRKTENKIF